MPLWGHVAALAVLLAVAFPFLSPNSSFTPDEGGYALQASTLAHGSWAYRYKAAPLDPTGASFPLVNSVRNGEDFYNYVQHPAYPELLRWTSKAFGGTIGLHLWPLAGVLATAIAAWLLAGEVDPRLRPWAFWLAALGPALPNGYVLWAHSLSAGIAGLTLVAAVRWVRRGLTPWRVAAVGVGAAAGVLVRSEGLLFAGALALAVVVVGTWRRALPLAAVASGSAFAAMLAERAWVRSIVGGAYENLKVRGSIGGYLAGRLSGARDDLFGGPPIALVALALVVVAGAWALPRWDGRSARTLTVAAGAAAALAVLQFANHPDDPIGGLLTAAPVLLLGLVLTRWRTADPTTRLLGATAAAFAAAVVASAYAGGGGLQWGGRFYSPLLAPLAVVAVAGIAGRHPRPIAVAVLAGLVAVGGGVGLLTVAHLRHSDAELIAAVARHPADVTVTTVPALPRVAWPIDGNVTWMLTRADVNGDALAALLASLRAQGVVHVVVIADQVTPRAALAAYPAVSEKPEPAFAGVGLTIFDLRA